MNHLFVLRCRGTIFTKLGIGEYNYISGDISLFVKIVTMKDILHEYRREFVCASGTQVAKYVFTETSFGIKL
jgi:hypothetical protein